MNTPTGRLWQVVGPFVLFVALSACGGGGDGGGTPPPLTGVFIDSPVQGLSYSSAPSGLSGLTGPKGEFFYRAGDLVTFSMEDGI